MKDYLVIDSDNYIEHGIETFFFSGGEPHAKLPEFGKQNILLFLKLRTWNDVGLAACVMDALANQEQKSLLVQEQGEDVKRRVLMPYFPGGRQDRTDGNTPLTVRMVAPLLARGPIHVFDPHSKSTINYLNAASEVLCPSRGNIATKWMPSDLRPALPRYDGVIAPDNGAMDRALNMSRYLGDTVCITADKVREFSTGKILKYDIRMLYEPGERYLVVDDICDGGATFNILADSVPKDVKLDLWVSHGIFSRGIDAISPRYERIFTTDSWYRHGCYSALDSQALGGNPRVTCLSLAPLFNKIMES